MPLESILKNIWGRLSAAVTSEDDPWQLPVLGTRGLDGPGLRTVVLRGVDEPTRKLFAQTDIRAPKVDHIRKDPRIEWLFYDSKKMTQVRAMGSAIIHHENDLAKGTWIKVPRSNQKNYASPRQPSLEVTSPEQAWPDAKDIERAFSNFAVIACTVSRIDWLQLNPSGRKRAGFTWNGANWRLSWLAP